MSRKQFDPYPETRDLSRRAYLTPDLAAFPRPPTLFPALGLCYNRPAVQRAWKQDEASDQPNLVGAVSQGAPPQNDSPLVAASPVEVVMQEDASRYCPVCSQRLESRRCKLICAVCGYYMSCADYY